MIDSGHIENTLRQGVDQGAFPGAVAFWGSPLEEPAALSVGWRGLTRNREPVSSELLYDMASLTKILVTTNLAMIFTAQGLLSPQAPLTTYFPELKESGPVAWANLTVGHLLAHQSGLRPWLPFYRLAGEILGNADLFCLQNKSARHAAFHEPFGTEKRCFSSHFGAAKLAILPTSQGNANKSAFPLAERKQSAFEAIAGQTPQGPPGERTVYSDLNFILLGFLLEKLGKAPLADLFQEFIAKPLGLSRTTFCPGKELAVAPTEDGFRWGGPILHCDAAILGATPLARVHDDNAAWLGGVAGHAGLFANAPDVWQIMNAWARSYKGENSIFPKKILVQYLTLQATKNDCGRYLGFQLPANHQVENSPWPFFTVGHTGYTGPALWWAPEKNFAWLFLTNRVHPRATNSAWRPGKYQFLGGERF